ncbi:MAG: GerMN domain-containing protein [Spirochaetia bacterium]|jgi:spore germination protein GerM|nr:GerMN domain-containing protein [Spirochaetia bacterium]
MKQNKKKINKKSWQPGCIFWIALILLVIALFLVNQKNMEKVIASTGFFNLFSPSLSKNEQSQPEIKRITENKIEAEKEIPSVRETEIEVVKVETEKSKKDNTPAAQKTPISSNKSAEETAAASFKVRDSILYFIVINDNGSTALKKTIRSIRYTDSPLTSTINSLLTGVSSSELNNNYISLIPEKTSLKKLWVSDGTAYIDFSENFFFNSFGREGYMGQLKQIVYTSTEFPTVKRVQILVEGEVKSYLGEGLFIGKPLTRQSLEK